MIAIVVLAISTLAAGYELRLLVYSKNVHDLIVSLFFLAIGLTFAALSLLNVDIPSPLLAVTNVFKPIHQFVVQLLS